MTRGFRVEIRPLKRIHYCSRSRSCGSIQASFHLHPIRFQPTIQFQPHQMAPSRTLLRIQVKLIWYWLGMASLFGMRRTCSSVVWMCHWRRRVRRKPLKLVIGYAIYPSTWYILLHWFVHRWLLCLPWLKSQHHCKKALRYRIDHCSFLNFCNKPNETEWTQVNPTHR